MGKQEKYHFGKVGDISGKNPDVNSIPEHAIKDSSKNEIPNSRRGFLMKLWGVLGVIATIEMIPVFAGFFKAGKNESEGESQHLVLAGNVSDFQLNSVYPFRSGKFYLARFRDGGFLAISLQCTHLGCSVIWNNEKKNFICPCHASSFDEFGMVTNPPAPRALDIFPVLIREGKVMVDIANPHKRNGYDHSQLTYA